MLPPALDQRCGPVGVTQCVWASGRLPVASFRIRISAHRPEGMDDSEWHETHETAMGGARFHPRRSGVGGPDELLRFGVQFLDGRKATTMGAPRPHHWREEEPDGQAHQVHAHPAAHHAPGMDPPVGVHADGVAVSGRDFRCGRGPGMVRCGQRFAGSRGVADVAAESVTPMLRA